MTPVLQEQHVDKHLDKPEVELLELLMLTQVDDGVDKQTLSVKLVFSYSTLRVIFAWVMTSVRLTRKYPCGPMLSSP